MNIPVAPQPSLGGGWNLIFIKIVKHNWGDCVCLLAFHRKNSSKPKEKLRWILQMHISDWRSGVHGSCFLYSYIRKLPCPLIPQLFLEQLSACLVLGRKDTKTDKIRPLKFSSDEFPFLNSFKGPEGTCLILPPYLSCERAEAQSVNDSLRVTEPFSEKLVLETM